MDATGIEPDTGQVVVSTEFVKPAQIVTEQRELSTACALRTGDQVNFGRNEWCKFISRQCVQGFSDDLRRETTDGKQYAPWKVGRFKQLGFGNRG